MTQIKLSSAQIEQLNAIDARDREYAYELGFAKFCEEQKLTKDEYAALYKAAMDKLASVEASKA